MDDIRISTAIKLLEDEIKLQQAKYLAALKNEFVFWQLKEIRYKIQHLQAQVKELEELQNEIKTANKMADIKTNYKSPVFL